jgi:eukaryotic-like serine/threonine-protein kinase
MNEGPVDEIAGDVLVAGRYRLLESTDRGGTRTVRRAADEVHGRTVVLEPLTSDAVPQARLAATVHHPHLVPILEVVEEPDAQWLVSEDVPARSLAQLVGEHGPMSAAAAADIGAQVASGLAAAHAAGVVHGAVTPENILVTEAVTGPVVTISGLGIPPVDDGDVPADAASDVHSLGTTLCSIVDGDVPVPLVPVLQYLTADDPAGRPTAEQVHVELAQLAVALAGPADPDPFVVPQGPAPHRSRRLHVLSAVAVAVAAVIGIVVALAVGSTAGPPPAPVASVPPVTAADERTLDPCSLIDVAALSSIGQATIHPGYGTFSECVAVIPVGADAIHVAVELRNAATAGLVDVSLRDPLNPVAVPAEQGDDFCSRAVLLPDGHVVAVAAVRYGDSLRADYCAVADIATDTAIARLTGRGFIPRTSDADRSALGEINACDLLDHESVVAAAAAARADFADGPTIGNAGWSCDWEPIWLDFMRESAPWAPQFYGYPVTIAGRPGMTRTDGGANHCRAYVPQRFFTASDGTQRAEYVRIRIDGGADVDTICDAVIALAEQVATELPPIR